jgi:hypothetical protein
VVSGDDWRIQGQDDYLLGKTLYWRQYKSFSETWEHDHCAFCWDKFEEGNSPGALHEGYSTEDNYHWVCQECFDDFREMFKWNVAS